MALGKIFQILYWQGITQMSYEPFEKVLNDESKGKVICANCLDILPHLPDGCIDLIVTSPPL